jgi:hypothetical protein
METGERLQNILCSDGVAVANVSAVRGLHLEGDGGNPLWGAGTGESSPRGRSMVTCATDGEPDASAHAGGQTGCWSGRRVARC